MAKAIVANAPHLDTREERALELYRHHGAEIEEIAPDIYLVPSQDGARVYRVDYANETCSCPDAEFHPEANCKHLLCVAIAHAKRRCRRECSLCYGTGVIMLGVEEDGHTWEEPTPCCRCADSR